MSAFEYEHGPGSHELVHDPREAPSGELRVVGRRDVRPGVAFADLRDERAGGGAQPNRRRVIGGYGFGSVHGKKRGAPGEMHPPFRTVSGQ